MPRRDFPGEYPPDWPAIARTVKEEAGWQCVRCGHPHDPPAGYTLTVHHLSGDKSDCRWFNCLPLCQRCHLQIQAKVDLARPWVFEHSDWFKVYVAAVYAARYLGQELTRAEVESRLGELLHLERLHVLGEPAVSP